VCVRPSRRPDSAAKPREPRHSPRLGPKVAHRRTSRGVRAACTRRDTLTVAVRRPWPRRCADSPMLTTESLALWLSCSCRQRGSTMAHRPVSCLPVVTVGPETLWDGPAEASHGHDPGVCRRDPTQGMPNVSRTPSTCTWLWLGIENPSPRDRVADGIWREVSRVLLRSAPARSIPADGPDGELRGGSDR
jgi:hypothetical protein